MSSKQYVKTHTQLDEWVCALSAHLELRNTY